MSTSNPTPNPRPEPEYHEILAARDARIRATTAEGIASAIEKELDRAKAAHYRAALIKAAGIARNYTGNRAESVAAGPAVPAEGSGHPHPHGDDDGHDGYMSTRCEEGRPGCVGRGCICRCHADQPGPGPWTGPRPTLTATDTEGDTDANH